MSKKWGMVLLTILSFGVSIYFFTLPIVFDEERFGSKGVMFFSIPFTLTLVNGSFFLLNIKKYSSYPRIKKGLDSIFLSLSVILFFLHCGLLFFITKSELLHFLIPLSVGIVLITTANNLPRFQLELHNNSPQSNRVWNKVIRPFSLPLYIGGIAMLFCVFIPRPLMMISFFTILLFTILISTIRSYRAYQKASHY